MYAALFFDGGGRVIEFAPMLMAEQLGINESAVKKHLNHLKDAGWLERVGGTRGYWAIKKEFGGEV